MGKDEILAQVIDELKALSMKTGIEVPGGFTSDMRPFGSLGMFTSLNGVDFTSGLEKRCGCDLGANIFIVQDRYARTINEVVNEIYELQKKPRKAA